MTLIRSITLAVLLLFAGAGPALAQEPALTGAVVGTEASLPGQEPADAQRRLLPVLPDEAAPIPAPAPEPAADPVVSEPEPPELPAEPRAEPSPPAVAEPVREAPVVPEPQPAPPVIEPHPQVVPPVVDSQPEPDPEPAVTLAESAQEIWQLQIGCLSHCDGTSQHQSARQDVQIEQVASLGAAVAVAVQIIVQVQIGCLAHCRNTEQTQRAEQVAAIVQEATATLSDVVQRIVQAQFGCRSDCAHDVHAQRASQSADVHQLAIATAEGGSTDALVAWIATQLATSNAGQGVQRAVQTQVAGCLSRCGAYTQTQEAGQTAAIEQRAAAGPTGSLGRL